MKYFKLVLIVFLVTLFSTSFLFCNGKRVENEIEQDPIISSIYHCLGPFGGRVDCLAVSSKDPRIVLLSSSEHPFISYDGGKQWDPITVVCKEVADLKMHPDNSDIMYIVDRDTVFVTHDMGKIWEKLKITELMQSPFYAFKVLGNGDKYISCASGLFYWSSLNKNWKQLFECLPGEAPLEQFSVSDKNENFIAAISGGSDIFITLDKGETWKGFPSSVFNNKLFSDIHILSLQVDTIFALYPSGIYMSSDKGETWNISTKETLPVPAYSFEIDSKRVFYAATQKGVWQSMDFGISWQYIPDISKPVYSLEVNDSNLYIGTSDGFYQYSFSEQNWNYQVEGFASIEVEDIENHSVEKQWYLMNDIAGNTFSYFVPLKEWETILPPKPLKGYFSCYSKPNEWFGLHKAEVWISSDRCKNWTLYSNVPTSAPIGSIWIHPENSDIWFAGTKSIDLKPGNGLWISKDEGKTWKSVSENFMEYSICDLLFDSTNGDIITGLFSTVFGENKLYQSTDRGITWNLLTEVPVFQKVISDQNMHMSIWGIDAIGNVWFSNDNAQSFNCMYRASEHYSEKVTSFPEGFDIVTTSNKGEVFVHLYRGIFLYSPDMGKNWYPIENMPDVNFQSMKMSPVRDNIIYLASDMGFMECVLDKRMFK